MMMLSYCGAASISCWRSHMSRKSSAAGVVVGSSGGVVATATRKDTTLHINIVHCEKMPVKLQI